MQKGNQSFMLNESKELRRPFKNTIREKQDRLLDEALKIFEQELAQSKMIYTVGSTPNRENRYKSTHLSWKSVENNFLKVKEKKYELKKQSLKLSNKISNRLKKYH